MEIRGDPQEGRKSRVFHLDLLNPLVRGGVDHNRWSASEQGGEGGLDLEEIWSSPTYFSGLLASGAGLAGRSLGNTYSSWELG